MIVNLRGTSGSGKTTLVRRIMDLYDGRCPVKAQDKVLGKVRRTPIGYKLWLTDPEFGGSKKPLSVLGSYEMVSGGADNLSGKGSLDYVATLARARHEAGDDVLYEGLVQGSDMSRIVAMHNEGLPVNVVFLNTSIEDCLASVRQRREAKGNTKPLDETSTRDKHKGLQRGFQRLQEMGVPALSLDRETAFQYLKNTLNLP